LAGFNTIQYDFLIIW